MVQRIKSSPVASTGAKATGTPAPETTTGIPARLQDQARAVEQDLAATFGPRFAACWDDGDEAAIDTMVRAVLNQKGLSKHDKRELYAAVMTDLGFGTFADNLKNWD